MPGSSLQPSSKSNHVFTCRPTGGVPFQSSCVDSSNYSRCWPAARELSGWCWLLLNGRGISPRAACKLLLSCCHSRLLLGTCCRAGGKLLLKLRGLQSYFLASFGPRFWQCSEPDAEVLSWDANQNPIDLLPKHTKTYNHAFTLFRTKRWHFFDVLVILWTLELDAFCNKKIFFRNIHESCVYMVFWYWIMSFCS
jgi:hypothetical protein